MHYLLILIFISPLYIHSNLGRESLFYPFNSLAWIFVTLCIFVFSWVALKNKQFFIVKRDFIIISLVFLMILLGGELSGVNNLNQWLVRVIAILIGFLFFMSLYQLQLNKRAIDNCLFMFVLAMLFQATIGYVQIFDMNDFFSFIIKYHEKIPLGHFQQPNVFASMMATLLIVSIYLVSSPSFKNRSVFFKIVLMTSIFSSAFMVVSSGSRIGLVSAIVTLPLILLARFYFLNKSPLVLFIIFLLVFFGGVSGSYSNEGFNKTFEKIENISTESQHDIRVHLYAISLKMFLDKPFVGHGIGSFQRVFHDHAALYQAERGGENLISTQPFSHPHNELLYWAIETGISGVLAVFTLIFIILRGAYRQGWQAGGAKLAMLLPIALHTQVEHPFYLSAYHYIVFIFLMFVLLYQKQRCEVVSLTRSASVAAQLFLAVLFSIVVYYCALAFSYSKRITLVMFQGGELSELYQIAKHPFFNDIATNLILASEFEQERGSGSTLMSGFFADWLDDKVAREPNPSSYIQMMDVHLHLGNDEKVKETAKRALYLFPNHPSIMDFIADHRIELVH